EGTPAGGRTVRGQVGGRVVADDGVRDPRRAGPGRRSSPRRDVAGGRPAPADGAVRVIGDGGARLSPGRRRPSPRRLWDARAPRRGAAHVGLLLRVVQV